MRRDQIPESKISDSKKIQIFLPELRNENTWKWNTIHQKFKSHASTLPCHRNKL